jgi:hypothetical protein
MLRPKLTPQNYSSEPDLVALTEVAILWNMYHGRECSSELGSDQIGVFPKAYKNLIKEKSIKNESLFIEPSLTLYGLWLSYQYFGPST